MPVFRFRFPGVIQGLLHGLSVADVFIHVLEAHHHAGPPAGHEYPDEIDHIVPRAALQFPDKADGEMTSRLKLLQDIRKADLFLHPRLVLFRDHCGYVFRFRFGIPGMAQRVPDGFRMDRIHIRVVEGTLFRCRVADEPYGVIGVGQRRDDRIACSLVGFPLLPLLRDI